jgi:hypothetical protein
MHGLYSNTIERFLLVDDDVPSLYETATVLTSKMLCNVIPVTLSEMNNHNCYHWKLGNPKGYRQSSPYPYLVIKSQDSYIEAGEQENTPPEIFKSHLDFVRMSYSIVKSALYTEMELPSTYTKIFNFMDTKDIVIHNDMGDGGAGGGYGDFEQGFQQAIYKIVYQSDNVDSLYETIMSVFNSIETSNLRKRKFYENLRKNAKPFFDRTLYTF